MSKWVWICAAGPVLAGAVSAEAEERLLKCELRQEGYYTGTPPEIIIAYTEEQSRLPVFDSFMKALERKPILGHVVRDDAKTLVFRWKNDDIPTNAGALMDWRYSLNWTKKTGRARITGRAAVSDGSSTGTGKCFFLKK